MITQVLHCPYCHETDIVRHGLSPEGKQRYRCRACLEGRGRTFLLDYTYAGQSPEVKQQIVDMAMNASGGLPCHCVDRSAVASIPSRCPGPPGLPAQCGTGPGAPGHHVETTALGFGTPRAHVAASKRGLKRGLAGRPRTVLLRLDETIITETPP